MRHDAVPKVDETDPWYSRDKYTGPTPNPPKMEVLTGPTFPTWIYGEPPYEPERPPFDRGLFALIMLVNVTAWFGIGYALAWIF